MDVVGARVSCDTSLANLSSEDFALPMHCDDGGSQMRKSFVALLLVLGAASLAKLALASGDDGGAKLMNAQMAQELRSRAARLQVSGPGTGDTTYVGFR